MHDDFDFIAHSRTVSELVDRRIERRVPPAPSRSAFGAWYRSIEKASRSVVKLRRATLPYVTIARLDHSTKHILIVPGIMLAYLLRGVHTNSLEISIVLGVITAICVASANYVINEWLDRDFDKFHPTKSQRP